MNQEKRAHFIERAALREAQKAIKRRGGEPLTRDDLLELRIQAAPFWLRVFLICLGLAAWTAGGFTLLNSDSQGTLITLLALGFILILIGVVGWRRTLEASLDTLE